MSSEIPMVSIVVRCYNRADTLARALQSIVDQTYSDYEIIVVDDGSTDSSREVAERFPNIRYVYQENQGCPGARRTGLQMVTGRYVSFLDSDDFWGSDFLAESIKGLEEMGCDLVFCNWNTCGPGVVREKRLELDRVDYLGNAGNRQESGWCLLSPEETRALFVAHIPAIPSASVFRRECLSLDWDSRVVTSDDWIMVLDAVVHKKITCAYHLGRRWTRWIDGKNICEGTSDMGKRARNEIHDIQLVLEQFAGDLNDRERHCMRTKLNHSYFDLAYILSRSGRPFLAVQNYVRSIGGPRLGALLIAIAKVPGHWMVRLWS